VLAPKALKLVRTCLEGGLEGVAADEEEKDEGPPTVTVGEDSAATVPTGREGTGGL